MNDKPKGQIPWIRAHEMARMEQAMVDPINNLFAPITRAYSEIEITSIALDGRQLEPNIEATEVEFTMTFKAKRKLWSPGDVLPGTRAVKSGG